MIEIKIAENHDLTKWDDIVDTSSMGTIFHKLEWLRAAEKHSNTKLFPLVIYKGQKIIGLFPIFYLKRHYIKMVFSPPPKCAIPYLGPIFCIEKFKQDKKENIYRQFFNIFMEYITKKLKYSYANFSCSPTFQDVRNLIWKGFFVSPRYNYLIPYNNLNDINLSISKSLRKNIKHAMNAGVLFKKDKPIIEAFYTSLKNRYNEQGRIFPLSLKYLETIIEKFDDRMLYFYAEYEKKKYAELLCITYMKSLLIWGGGYSSRIKVSNGHTVYPNDLLHWKVIEYAIENKYKDIQIIGANTPHICQFKSKFNPSLQIYFNAEKATTLAKIVKSVYLLYLLS